MPPRQPTPQQGRPVWGIPLAEAVEATQPEGADVLLPAVVYRCLEYLKAKNAHREEGIFRLSGSNIVIKALRERFNTERDIRLLEGEYYDVHAVASLLKSYLRDLPVSILTRELHLDFLKVLEMDQRSEKIDTFNMLVHKLPPVNLDLLRALSSFLIDITNNYDINKMTIRNVGIVFSPTLNIPGPLISFFITDYHDIFGSAKDEATSPMREVTVSAPLTPESVRSPRHQMFSDLPTPAYQGTFQEQHKQQQSTGSSNPSGMREPAAPYDTGFIPMQPSYDSAAYGYGEGYGSLNSAALAPSTSREARARKRESGMLLMNMGLGGQRKSSLQRLREEPGMVQEESAFE
ncbi:putative rho gtpase activator [Diplodia seriata]|nr:putative rho gtpase activator [Diplodia seriata]